MLQKVYIHQFTKHEYLKVHCPLAVTATQTLTTCVKHNNYYMSWHILYSPCSSFRSSTLSLSHGSHTVNTIRYGTWCVQGQVGWFRTGSLASLINTGPCYRNRSPWPLRRRRMSPRAPFCQHLHIVNLQMRDWWDYRFLNIGKTIPR